MEFCCFLFRVEGWIAKTVTPHKVLRVGYVWGLEVNRNNGDASQSFEVNRVPDCQNAVRRHHFWDSALNFQLQKCSKLREGVTIFAIQL